VTTLHLPMPPTTCMTFSSQSPRKKPDLRHHCRSMWTAMRLNIFLEAGMLNVQQPSKVFHFRVVLRNKAEIPVSYRQCIFACEDLLCTTSLVEHVKRIRVCWRLGLSLWNSVVPTLHVFTFICILGIFAQSTKVVQAITVFPSTAMLEQTQHSVSQYNRTGLVARWNLGLADSILGLYVLGTMICHL